MNFAFLVHARDYTDISRKFKVAGCLPKKLIEFWCFHWPPFVVSKISVKNAHGWIIGIPMTAWQILENRPAAKNKIIRAIKKAEKLGAKIVGLGALTSPVTDAGHDLLGKVSVKITTGNALTVVVSVEHIREILKNNPAIKKIAIVGGTGSIGSAICKILLKNFSEKDYLIFGRSADSMKSLSEGLRAISSTTKVSCYINDLEFLKEADLVVVATSASGAVVESRYLKSGSIVYDVTQPKNVSEKNS